MGKLAVFLAEGFEEIEALTVVDICRRCGLQADMVSVTGAEMVKSSHGVSVQADRQFSEVDFGEYDMLVLPGGMPGTKNLEAHEGLMEQVKHILQVQLEDNVKAHVLLKDGTYEKIDKRGKRLINSQEQFCQEAKAAVPKQAHRYQERVFIPMETEV